jgi:tetratricopeptide (TPR) repeat protein
VAASLSDEPALSGALSRELRRILTNGPRNPDLRWDRKREYIRGDDLVQALRDDWSEPRQTPEILTKGSRAWDLVHNPLYEKGLPDQVVEHLLQAARSNSGTENFFTGREAELSRVVAWLEERQPGLFVLTGPPGSGKSAIVGRIVSLSSKDERARILEASPIAGGLDPQEGSINGHIQARGVTVETAAAEFLRRLNLDPADGRFGLLSAAERRRKEGHPLTLVVDGLDEAGPLSRDLATELLKPLAQESLLLVSTREIISDGTESLIASFGPAAVLLDLADDAEGTAHDIRAYVVRRLQGVSPAMDPALVADEILTSSGAPTSFLLARLVTSQLREEPVDTSAPGWQTALSVTVESALERDLQGAVIEKDGQPSRTAAREMLRALTLAYGNGFPADDVWPEVATAISDTDTKFTRDDAYNTLAVLGRHLVASSEGDQAVYRIAHQRLIEYLSAGALGAVDIAALKSSRAAAAPAVFNLYTEYLDAGFQPDKHQYLWRFAWRHLADAGDLGLDLLRKLVDRNRTAFLPLYASGLELASSETFATGAVDIANNYLEEAVTVWRELQDPPRLCMALFQLSLTRLAKGDQEGADKAAAEASDVAKELPESSDQKRLLATSLLGRAFTQLGEGRFEGAKLLSEKSLALAEAQEQATAGNLWTARALASLLAGKAAGGLGDFPSAIRLCQQTVDLIDQNDDPNTDPVLPDALATLTSVNYSYVLQRQPRDGNGNLLPASCAAGERLIEIHRHGNKHNKIIQVDIARGLYFVVASILLDTQRGLDISRFRLPDLNSLHALVNEIIQETLPHSAQYRDAALVLAYALQLRAAWRVASGDPLAAQDRSDAAKALSPLLDKNPMVAGALGVILNAFATVDLAAFTGDPQALNDLLTLQQEACSYLRRGGPYFGRPLLQALSQLASICKMAGRADLQESAVSEAVNAARELVGRASEAPLMLAAMLSDQAGVNVERPLICARLATEALNIVESVPPSDQVDFVTASCKINLAASKKVLGEVAGAVDLLQDAIRRLEKAPENPFASGGLATAYTNLALLQIDSQEFEPALASARRALGLFAQPSAFAGLSSENEPLAHIAEGWALQGIGEKEKGASIVTQILHEMLARLRGGTETPTRVAGLLSQLGNDIWDETMPSLSDRPDLMRAMMIRRIRPRQEVQLTVQTLVNAVASCPPSELMETHAIARSHRSSEPALFDAAWQAATGELPAWLKLDLNLIAPVILWLNAKWPEASKNYLEAHPELLSPATDAILEEICSGESDGSYADVHIQLLAKAREVGVAAAYAPVLASAAVERWVNSKDPIEYLNENPGFLTPDVVAFVSERANENPTFAALAGVLELAKRGEIDVAAKVGNNPDNSLDFLRSAWRAKDITRLIALANIVRLATDNPSVFRKATTALAVAKVLDGQDSEAAPLIEQAKQDATPEDRQQLVAIVNDAITNHLASAAPLASLIPKLLSPTGESSIEATV